MPKVKPVRHTPLVDMTAMTDVAFLLLTFFMLTAKMKPQEPVVIDTPSSISEIKLPETDILMLSVDKDGKVFFNMDGQQRRKELIDKVNEQMALGLSEEEKINFALCGTFGVPTQNLKAFLAASPVERKDMPTEGIPSDTSRNELAMWVTNARIVGENKYRIVIKADKTTKYPALKKVINTLQDLDINKFNLITSLEMNPNKTNPGILK